MSDLNYKVMCRRPKLAVQAASLSATFPCSAIEIRRSSASTPASTTGMVTLLVRRILAHS